MKINKSHALDVHSVVMLMTRAHCPAAAAAAAHANYVDKTIIYIRISNHNYGFSRCRQPATLGNSLTSAGEKFCSFAAWKRKK